MSKYYVTHSCGHEERIDLIGPQRSRQWRLDKMAQELCGDCWQRWPHKKKPALP